MQQKLLSATSPYETFVLNLKKNGTSTDENRVGKDRDAALTRYTKNFTNKLAAIEKQSQSQSQHQHQQPQSQQEQHQSHQQDKADDSFLGNTTTLTSLSSVVQSPQNLSFSPISTNSEHYLQDNSNTTMTMTSMDLTDSHHSMETLMEDVEISLNTDTALNLPSSQANASMQEEKLPQSPQDYIFSCYLQDLQYDFTFPNTVLIKNAKPCQFLRAQDLHYVQCLQSFLYVVYRRDPATIDIPFLKV